MKKLLCVTNIYISTNWGDRPLFDVNFNFDENNSSSTSVYTTF